MQQQQNPEASSTITQCSSHGSPSTMNNSSQADLNLQSISTPMITSEDTVPASMETSNAKDELVKQHMKIAEDAIAGVFLVKYLFIQIERTDTVVLRHIY